MHFNKEAGVHLLIENAISYKPEEWRPDLFSCVLVLCVLHEQCSENKFHGNPHHHFNFWMKHKRNNYTPECCQFLFLLFHRADTWVKQLFLRREKWDVKILYPQVDLNLRSRNIHPHLFHGQCIHAIHYMSVHADKCYCWMQQTSSMSFFQIYLNYWSS